MNQIDFLPNRIKQHRGRLHQLRVQGMLLAICVCSLFLLAYVNHGRVAQAQGALTVKQATRQAVQNQLRLIPGLTSQQTDVQVKVRISKELGSRMDLNAVLAELGRLLPKTCNLTSLDCRTVEVEARPSASIAGGEAPLVAKADRRFKAPMEMRVKLLITGWAPTDVDVANFIGQLSGCPLFEDVNMGFARTVEIDGKSRKARDFQVSCLLVR